jgi:secreted Zn-dependent insulinase-like peptidase
LEELHRATYLEMISQIAREPAFDTLRTKQQLGECPIPSWLEFHGRRMMSVGTDLYVGQVILCGLV